MQLTRTLPGPHSTARLRAICISAALEMPYAPSRSEPLRPPIDDTRMTDPPPRRAIAGMVIWQSQWLLRTLLPMILSNALSGISWLGPKCGLTAALQTRMSTGPRVLFVSSTSRVSSSFWPMLHGMTTASPPRAAIPARTSSQASGLRLETTTLAPKAAIASAIARPMPFDDPVIRATLPVRSNSPRIEVSSMTVALASRRAGDKKCPWTMADCDDTVRPPRGGSPKGHDEQSCTDGGRLLDRALGPHDLLLVHVVVARVDGGRRLDGRRERPEPRRHVGDRVPRHEPVERCPHELPRGRDRRGQRLRRAVLRAHRAHDARRERDQHVPPAPLPAAAGRPAGRTARRRPEPPEHPDA